MNQTLPLKISFPELEKEIFYNFPRGITTGQLLDILAQQGIITDRRLLGEYQIFVPWSGIWLNKQRFLDSYALVEEEPLELWSKPTFPKDFILIHVPDLEITEKIAFFPNFTNGRGAIQALEAKERLNIEMYGLYDPEKGAWIEINEPLSNYGFVNGSYLEYVIYSEEVAEARKRAFQAKQQQKQQQEMHSRQGSIAGGQSPLTPRASDAKYRRPTASLHVTAPFFANKTLLSFSTSDTAAGVVSKVKWFGNQPEDVQGYDVRVLYRDGSSNAMDDLSPLSFYETNFAGEPYVCLELVPNGTSVPPPSPKEAQLSPRQPINNGPATVSNFHAPTQEFNTTPTRPLNMSQPASQPAHIQHSSSNHSTPVTSPLSSPLNPRVAELQSHPSSGSTPTGSSASTPYGSPMSNGTMSPSSNPGTPEISRASVSSGESIMLKIEVPNLQIGKMIKCTWNDTPQEILTKLREKKVFVDDSYTLVIPKNKKSKLNTIVLDPNSPLSAYRSTGRIKASESLFLLDEKEAQKLKDKGGYEGGPTGQKVPKRGSVSEVLRKVKNAVSLPARSKGSISIGKPAEKEEKHPTTDVVIPYKFPVLKQLVDFLETRAFMDEGIFRISSNADLINQYYPILANLPDISKMKNHDVASLLKKYLRDMPESLIPRSRFDTFLEAQKATSADERAKALRNAINSLPEDNKNGLKILFKLLHKIHENSNANKMTSSNLAIIFGPVLLRSPGDDSVVAMVSSSQFQTNVVQTMIVNYTILFEQTGNEASKFTNIFRSPSAGANETPTPAQNKPMATVPEHEHGHNAATAQILNSYNISNMNNGMSTTLTQNVNVNNAPSNTDSSRTNEFGEDNVMTSTFGIHLNEEAFDPFNDVPFDNPFDDLSPSEPLGLNMSPSARSPKGSASGQSGFNMGNRSPKGSASGQSGFGENRSPAGSVQTNNGTLRGHTNILAGGNTSLGMTPANNYFNTNGVSNAATSPRPDQPFSTSPRPGQQQFNASPRPDQQQSSTSPRPGQQQYSTSPPKTNGFNQQAQFSTSPPKANGFGQRPGGFNQPQANNTQQQNGYNQPQPSSQPQQVDPGQPKSPRPGLVSQNSQPKLVTPLQPNTSLAPPTSPRRVNTSGGLTVNTALQTSQPLFDSNTPLARPALGAQSPKRSVSPLKRLDVAAVSEHAASTAAQQPTSPRGGQTSPRGLPGPIGRDGTQYHPTPRPAPNTAPPKSHVKAQSTPAPARTAAPSVTSRSSEISDLAVVVSALLSSSAPPAVKSQYAVKLANYMSTDGDYVRSYLKDKVGIDNAIKLIEAMAHVIKARN